MLSKTQEKYLSLIRTNLVIEGREVLEIGCGDGHLVRALLDDKPHRITGIDYSLGSAWGTRESYFDRASLREMDAADLKFENSFFDCGYSINTFEHIDNLPNALSELARVLKPGGVFFTIFSPIWSSRLGHHFKHWQDDINRHIPPWGHLYLSEEEMFERVHQSSKSIELAKAASSSIYRRRGLNRKHHFQYLELFKQYSGQGLKFELNTMIDREFARYSQAVPDIVTSNPTSRPEIHGFIGMITRL